MGSFAESKAIRPFAAAFSLRGLVDVESTNLMVNEFVAPPITKLVWQLAAVSTIFIRRK